MDVVRMNDVVGRGLGLEEHQSYLRHPVQRRECPEEGSVWVEVEVVAGEAVLWEQVGVVGWKRRYQLDYEEAYTLNLDVNEQTDILRALVRGVHPE